MAPAAAAAFWLVLWLDERWLSVARSCKPIVCARSLHLPAAHNRARPHLAVRIVEDRLHVVANAERFFAYKQWWPLESAAHSNARAFLTVKHELIRRIVRLKGVICIRQNSFWLFDAQFATYASLAASPNLQLKAHKSQRAAARPPTCLDGFCWTKNKIFG